VIEIYQFYRSVIPATNFEILSIAFDEQRGQLFVKLIQRPKLRFNPSWIPVALPMLICFTLVKREYDGEGRYYIDAIEDFVQPMVSLDGVPFLQLESRLGSAMSLGEETIGGCEHDKSSRRTLVLTDQPSLTACYDCDTTWLVVWRISLLLFPAWRSLHGVSSFTNTRGRWHLC
jgi:hypothetical protein